MNCKVISTAFNDGRRIDMVSNFPYHRQNTPTKESVLQMVKNIVEYEKELNPGVPVDLIIVNNDCGFKEGNAWIKEMDGASIHSGVIKTITRENTGGSFGGYNDAYDKFKDLYDYWLFTEDDIVIGGKNYYKRIIDRFESVKKCGFVSPIAVAKFTDTPHCHGGVGLTHKKVLEKVVRKNGSLPHDEGDWDKNRIIESGELPFTNIISQLGFELIEFEKISDWNLKRGCCLPYYQFNELHE